MRIQHVQTLLALSDANSIRAAAEKLGKSQSALTKQLRAMENDLGLALFQRGSQGIVPTEAGQALLIRARAVQSELQRFEQEVASLCGKQQGSLSVSVTPLVAVKVMPRAVVRFRKSFPDISMSVASEMFSDALNGLRDGRHDLIIGPFAEASKKSSYVYEKLFSTEVCLITSKNAPHANATSLAELRDCVWTRLGSGGDGPERRFIEHFTALKMEPPHVRISSESRLGLVAMIEELDAVCTFPQRLVDDWIPEQNITRIPIKETLQPLTIALVTRAGQTLTPAAQHFAECIRHRVQIMRREWGDLG